ncbi:hypothetical protein KVV02_008769 [Mortierella alpina]|uniref:RING-type domain-containing protein n=1 Tax=Mortierella alpina TaxID=64518 RepID=A0A9P8CW44_MORAP|nr:hypothetical protein KVV02_008769 [Mortierella alpina]
MDPQAVHLPRPLCFCGLIATAIYPDPDCDHPGAGDSSSSACATYASAADLPSTPRGDTVWAGTRAGSGWPIPSSPKTAARRKRSQAHDGQPASILLRSNWVYECHFTPKQEGSVAPDPCLDCQDKPLVDTAKHTTTATDDALKSEELLDEHVVSAVNSWNEGWDTVRTGTLDDYYNPENVDSTQWPTSLGTPSGWDRDECTREDSSRGRYVDREPKHDPWDHASSRSPDAEPHLASMSPASLSSPPTQQSRSSSELGGALSKTSLSKEQPLLPTSPMDATAKAHSGQNVLVCGFHMHALEWHCMQALTHQEILTLAQRANCPIFNLSITRWLDQGINHLAMEPFTPVKCFCGDTMIVTTEFRHLEAKEERYDLACPNRSRFLARPEHVRTLDDEVPYEQDTLEQRIGMQARMENVDSSPGHQDPPKPGCSRVLPLKETKYRPRTHPVHTVIENDEWLDRILHPNKPTLSSEAYFQKRPEGWGQKPALKKKAYRHLFDHSTQEPAQPRPLKRVIFCDWNEEHEPPIPLQSGGDNNEEKEEEGLSLLDWSNEEIAERFLDDDNFDVWDEQCLRRLDAVGFSELPKSLLDFAGEEALADAYGYAERLALTYQDEIDYFQTRTQETKLDLEEEKAAHALEVKAVTEMEANSLVMPRVKCRICYENTITHAIIPCYHLITCGECSTKIVWCVLCRARKTGTQRIFWG